MLNNYKMIKKLEDKISELEKEIPDEYDIRDIAREVIDEEKEELSNVYEVRSNTREDAWNAIVNNVEGVVKRQLPALVKEATKDIQDKLIVELARKAMNMERKESKGGGKEEAELLGGEDGN